MKYWIGVQRVTGDANKDMFDYRRYSVDASGENEATEKGRALALADDPEHTNLKIYVHMGHEEAFTWRKKTRDLLEDAIDGIKSWEDAGVIGLITAAMQEARLDNITDTTNMTIDSIRHIAQKTQREVSDKVGITLNNYARLERGEADVRKMSLENAMKLCEVLRVNPYELMNAGDNSRKHRLDKSTEGEV